MRFVLILALAVCSAMVVDELSASPAFCRFQAGCEQVVQSPFGRPFGVPLSAIGLVCFAGLFGLTLLPQARAGSLVACGAYGAALGGAGLIAVQLLSLRRVCPLCMLVDAAGLILAAWQLASPFRPTSMSALRRGVWGAAACLAVLVPVVWSVAKPGPAVPAEVQRLWRGDRVNVVELTDLACPHCRRLHPVLGSFVASRADELHFVRMVVPLSKEQAGALAAKLALAAEERGLGEGFVDAVFRLEELSTESVRRAAIQTGFSAAEIDAASADPGIESRIAERVRWASEGEGGLPQVWMDNVLLLGEQTAASLEAGLARAKRQKQPR